MTIETKWIIIALFSLCLLWGIVVLTSHPNEMRDESYWQGWNDAIAACPEGCESDGGSATRASEKIPADCQVYLAGMIRYHPPGLITGWATCGGSRTTKYYQIVSEDGEGSLWVNTTSGHVSNESFSWVFDDEKGNGGGMGWYGDGYPPRLEPNVTHCNTSGVCNNY